MSNNFGLYIHIPFCKSKCPYCDFYSGKGNEEKYNSYTDILKKRIISWSQKVNRTVTSIYFGGGTPSVLGTDRVVDLLCCVKKHFSVDELAEITVEVNPESVKDIDFCKLSQCGFNRISIGMQSAVQNELNALGRLHSADDAKFTVEKAKKAGISNVSLDLMMGIPNQTIDSLKRSIDFCVECGVTHISSYILKVEKGTRFYAMRDNLVLPSDDEQADLYLFAVDYLDKLGFEQYEISNFARKGFEGKHNINYWKCGEYIGIGPSAHSFFNGERFYYEKKISEFENDKTVFDCTGGNEEEFIMLSLRLKSGLNFKEYQEKFGSPIPSYIVNKLKLYAKNGLVTMDEQRACFTPNGFLVSNSIISSLI